MTGGPLAGVRVVELAGLGPAPFGAMVLADLGADVVVVDRADRVAGADPVTVAGNVTGRGRRSVGVDLKSAAGVEVVLRLIDGADVLLEGFRPGVLERLGLGPELLAERNPRLVVGRMTGWGQEGPRADSAGHDINYVAVAGPLAHIGRANQPPTVPLNLVGDFGGGGMLLVVGVMAALVERERSGLGQVVDAAMVDGAALLAAPIVSAYTMGFFSAARGTNLLDSGAPFYDCYECADGRWLSIGAIEPQFHAALLEGLGIDGESYGDQNDQTLWAQQKARVAALVATRPRDHWVRVFAHLDACVAPVHSFTEVLGDRHITERATWVDRDGVVQPSPAPRFSRTPAELDRPPAPAGHHTEEVLLEAGFSGEEVAALREAGAVV